MRDVALGWPFLVARGRDTDYRTVLAPDFLVDASAYGVLSDSVWRGDMRDGEVRVVALDSPGAGQITVIYTSERLERLDELSASGESGLADEHGRPLQILYGLVTRHRLDGDVHPNDLRMARGESLASYKRFLADEHRFGVDRSSELKLRGVTARPPTPPPRPPPSLPRNRARPLVLGVGGGVAAIIVALASWALLTRNEPSVKVQLAQPTVGGCTKPMALTASITTDRATTVKYHWELPPGKTVASGKPLKFTAGGTQQVHASVRQPHPPDSGRVDKVAYALVVDAPKQQRTPGTYRVGCVPRARRPARGVARPRPALPAPPD